MMMKFREEKGFTLVELLIVIAILAILAVAAAPKFVDYKNQADANTCKNNQAALETACEQYAFSNKGNYPSDVKALVTANIIKKEVTCPSGSNYVVNTGVVTCTKSSGSYAHAK